MAKKNTIGELQINPTIQKIVDEDKYKILPTAKSGVGGYGVVEYAGPTTFGESKYDLPTTGIESIKIHNLDELRGERQPTMDKAVNGTIRAVAKIAPRVAEGIINPIYGPIAAIIEKDKSKIWDNAITKASVEASEWLDKELPLYQTLTEKNAHGFEKLLYANTLWGDILDGMSYSASAMLSGNAYMKAGQLMGKTAAAGKLGDYLNKLSNIENTTDKVKYIKTVDDAFKTRVIGGLEKGMYSGIGATVEASDNALSDSNEYFKEMEYKLTHDEQGNKVRELTQGEKEWLEINRKNVGNTSFALNYPVIMFDNHLTFGKTILSKRSIEKELFSDVSNKIGRNTIEDTYYAIKKSKIDNVLDKTYGIRQVIKPMIPEGVQETTQLGITKGVQDYYTKKYYNPNAASFMDSFGEGFNAAMSEEGLENFLIGAASSGIFGNIVKLKHGGLDAYRDKSDETVTAAIDFLNKNKSKPAFKTMVESIYRHNNLVEEQDQASKNKDDFEYMNKAADMMINHITSKIKTGKLQDFKDDIESFKNLTPEQFEQEYGIKLSTDALTGMKESVSQFIEPKLKMTNKVESLYNSLNNIAPNAPESIKDRLLYATFTIDDSAERSNELSNKVRTILTDNFAKYNQMGVNGVLIGGQLIGYDYNKLTPEQRIQFRNQLDVSEINPLHKEEVFNYINDIDKLDKRKLDFVAEYKNLLNPQTQEEIIKKDEQTENEVNTILNTDDKVELNQETIKTFADKIQNGEKLETDEDIEFYTNNAEEIETELKNKVSETKEEITSTDIETKKADVERRRQEELEITTEDKSTGINEEDINSYNTDSNIASVELKKNGKIAITPFKTESGVDDNTDVNRTRYFRYIEKNKVSNKKLLIVTKKNNLKLYNELLELRPEAKEFENKNPNYQGIYVVLVDKNNEIILSDEHGKEDLKGKPIFTTLTTIERLEKGDVKHTEEEKDQLLKLRGDILKQTNSNITLSIVGKSTGILQYLPKVNEERVSNSVIGRLITSIKDAFNNVILLSTPLSSTSEVGLLPNNKTAKIGKLYLKDKNGNWIDLVPRKLNSNEIDITVNLINQLMGVSDKTVSNPKKELEKIMFLGIPKRGIQQYTIAIRDNKLIIGKETLTSEQYNTEEGKNKLINALQNKVVNISREHDLNSEFESPKTSDEQETVKFNSYAEYLISGENPMFGTDVPLLSEIQYRNQYLIYEPKIIYNTIKEEKIEESILLNYDEEIVETLDLKEIEKPKEGTLGTVLRKPKSGRSLDRPAILDKKAKHLTKEEIIWFKSNFPNIPIETIQGLIEGKSFGRFLSEAKILLSDVATEGTLYHEAFHAVTQLYLTKEEINKLYSELSKTHPNKSRLELEEILAEDFANYKSTGLILNNRPQRNSIFRKLLNFIKDLLNIKTNGIEDIYRRLDKGYYKSKPIIGIKEFTRLDKKIQGLSVKETKELLDSVDSIFYEILIDDNNKTVGELYSKPELVSKILNIIKSELDSNEFIKNNWDNILNAWADRFKSISGEIDLGEDFNSNKEGDVDNENIDSRQGDALPEFNVISTKSLINKETRLLIRGLKQKEYNENEEIVDKLNSLGLSQPVEFSSTYNFILRNLQGISDWQDQYNKLVELSKSHFELIALTERLGNPSGDLSMDKFIQWMKFRQDFDKNKISSHITIIEADGNIYLVDATKQANYDKIKETWKNNLKSISEISTKGELKVNLDILKIADNIKFLQSLGIKFSPDTLLLLKDNYEFNQSVNQIRDFVKLNNGNVTNLFTDGSGIVGRLNTLYQLEGDNNKTVNELSFISTENKTVYSIAQNNMLSIVKNIINDSETIQELYTRLPHLNTISTEGSLWLSKLFNQYGERNKNITLDLDLHDGIKNNNPENKQASSTRKLTIGEKYVQEINSILLNGKSSFIRASDKSSEFIVSLNKHSEKSKLTINIEDVSKTFNIQKVRDIFGNYFKAEMKRIALFELKDIGKDIDVYNKNGGKFTIFEGFKIDKKVIKERINQLSPDLSIDEISIEIDKIYNEFKEDINEGIVDFLNNYSLEVKNKLTDYNINLEQGLSEDLKKYNIEQLSRAIAINDLINSIEQVKLFIGDMGFYKDLFKRTSAFTGTKETSATGEEINKFLNNNNKRKDKKVANDNINIVTFEDSKQQAEFLDEYTNSLVESGLSIEESKKILSPYESMDEGDAQGWITLDEYREFAIRRGDWNNKLEQAFDKLQNEETLTSKELITFLTLKAQYAGPQSYNNLYVPTYHKYSLIPLIPQLVRGTNMDKLLVSMTENQVGYALFKSGSKVGTKVDTNNKTNLFYNKNGSINITDWTKQIISYKFFGLQVKSSSPKSKVIFGTQFRKLLFLDLFEKGESKNKELYNEYNKIISDLIDDEKSKLLKEIGADKDNYKIEDVRNLVSLLQNEAKKRSLSDNIIEALQYEIIEGKYILKYNFDTMINKAKIDSMIMSLIDSRLIRQKMNGDSLIQTSVAGFESINKKRTGVDHVLKFYRKDNNGNTLPAQCKIVLSKEYLPLLKEYNNDLFKLNQAIKNEKVDKKLLNIIGYRIPTQGLNSMEFLEIVEFLPQELGTSIILPTEIVAKSGGDFDIDKLNVFRPNIIKDFEYLYKNIQHIINEDIERFNETINNNSPESNLIKDIFRDSILDEKQELETLTELKISKSQFDKFKKLANKSEFELYYKKQLAQNRIIEITKEILSSPDNFNSLITPNSTSILKELANKFDYETYLNKEKAKSLNSKKEFKPITYEEYLEAKETGAKNIRYSNQLKLTNKIEQFYKFMLAKDMIGIAAIANTHHSLSQQVNTSLETSYVSQDGTTKSTNINFPYNETEDNKISLSNKLDSKNENKISDIISQIINATVDAAKDPFMFTINMTKDTLPTYLYLIRIGVPFNIIGNFMKQPIIIEYLRNININKSSYIKDKKANKELLNRVKYEYKRNLSKSLNIKPEEIENYLKDNKILFSEEQQLSQFLNIDNQNSELYYQTQLQVLDDFLKYKEQAQLLSDAIRASNIDTAGVGKNLSSSQQKLDLINKVKETKFFNGLDKILENTFIKSMNVSQFTIDLYKDLYYTQQKEIKENIDTLINNIKNTVVPFNSEDYNKLRTLIENDFINYVIQNYGYNDITIIQNNLFNLNSVAKRLIKAKSDISLKDNLVIQELYPLISQVADNIDNVKLYGKRYDSYTSNLLTEAFRELGESDNSNGKQLYKDLMDLGIIQSGLNNSPITYLGIIPFEYYNNLTKKAFEEFNKKNGVNELNKFNELFIRNNTKNSLIWKYAKEQGLSSKSLGYNLFGKIYNKSQSVKYSFASDNLNTERLNIFKKLQQEGLITQTSFKTKNEKGEFTGEFYKIPKMEHPETEAWRLKKDQIKHVKDVNKYNRLQSFITKNNITWMSIVEKPNSYLIKLDNNVLFGIAENVVSEINKEMSKITEDSVRKELNVSETETLNDFINKDSKLNTIYNETLKANERVKVEFNDELKNQFDSKTNTVSINLRECKAISKVSNLPLTDVVNSMIEHELVHSATYFALESSSEFTKEINNLLESFKKADESKPFFDELRKGFREEGKTYQYDIHEFVADINANKSFQNYTKNITPKGENISWYNKLYNSILRLLNKHFKTSFKLNTVYDNIQDILINEEFKEENAYQKEIEEVTLEKILKGIPEENREFSKQELFFERRIKRLERKLKELKKDTDKYKEVEEELENIKSKFEDAKSSQSEDLYKELGDHTLDKAEEFINDLESGSVKDSAYNMEYTLGILNIWKEFPGLETKARQLERRLKPFKDEFTLRTINKYSTEKEEITKAKLDSQDQDIKTFRYATGSLSDLGNYIGRTIGSIIRRSQNKIETKNKEVYKQIKSEIDNLNEYAKKNGVELEELYKIFVQEQNGTWVLAKEYYKDGTENANWTKIQNTPELKQFYDFYQKSIDEAQSDLPFKLGKHFIPNIKTSDLKSELKGLSPIKTRVIDKSIEEENILDIIELQYHKPININEKSTDLATNLFEFIKYSNNYSEMSEILPTVRLLQSEVEQRKYRQSSNSTVFIEGKKTNLHKMIDTIIEMQIKGKMKLEQGIIKIGDNFIDEKGIQKEKVVDLTKLTDNLLRYNSLLRIGLSPVTAVSNILFGDLSNVIEAVGGRFITLSGLRQSTNIFFKQTFDKDSILNKLLTELNPLQELDDYELSEQIRLTGKTTKVSTEKLIEYMYAPQKQGEKFLQSRTMLAIMIKDGYLTSQGQLTDKYNKSTEEEKLQLSDKIQRLNQKIHGRYTTKEAAALSQNVLYRLVTQFRKWIPAAIENRVGSKQWDNRLQTETEGIYLTFGRLVLNNWKTPSQAFENMLLPLFASKRLLEEGKMTETEIYNMKRMMMEIISAASLMLLYSFLHGGDEDEDKKRRKNPLIKTGLTLLNRASGDLTFFYSPEQLNNLGKNAVPLSKTVGDIIQAVNVIPHTLYTGDYIIKKGSYRGQYKITKEILDILPVVKPIQDVRRILSPFDLEELR